MTHDSLIRSHSGRMSPAALALAIGLHVLVAAALWWASPLRPFDHAETPIMISIEPEPLSAGSATAAASPAPPTATASPAPAPAEPKTTEATPAPSEPPQQAALAPSPPPPAPTLTEPPPQATTPAPIEAPAPPPPPAVAKPAPPPVPLAAPPRQQVAAPAASPAPAPPPAPEPTATEALPPAPVEAAASTPPPPSEAEAETAWQTDASSWKPQVTLEPSLATPPKPVRPPYRPAPRPAQVPGQRLQDYPPPTASLGGPSSSSFESTMAYGGERNDYLSRVYRHIEPYRDYPAAARVARQHGRVATRVTIDRAGGLIDIRIEHSSGWPLLDNAEMAAIRRALPLPPVPDGMRGDPVVLVLNMNY